MSRGDLGDLFNRYIKSHFRVDGATHLKTTCGGKFDVPRFTFLHRAGIECHRFLINEGVMQEDVIIDDPQLIACLNCDGPRRIFPLFLRDGDDVLRLGQKRPREKRSEKSEAPWRRSSQVQNYQV